MSNDDNKSNTQLRSMIEGAAGDDQLTQVNDHIWVSKDVSDSILITTDDASVVINSGMPGNGGKHKERFQAVSAKPIRYLIVTQCHGDHFGGAHELRDQETEIITHRDYPACRQYWKDLEEFYGRRSSKLWGSVIGDHSETRKKIVDITPDITFGDEYGFELGGRRFELYAAPGGESRDGVVVWLPRDRTVLTGNLFGPVFGNMPNLYTIRGDKIRSAKGFVESLDRVMTLKPETIITGHEVFSGEQKIADILTKVRDAVMYLYDQTIAGMNAGKDVHTLMAEIQLPEHLQIGQAHGKVPWCVRAIWEEHAGWFHYESTTELYPVPPRSVANDILDLVGEALPLVSRAQRYVKEGKPLQALHLIDIVLAAEPTSPTALKLKIDAHQKLLEQSTGENFSEVMWLKSEMETANRLLDENY